MIWPVSCWLEENSTDVDQRLETHYLPYVSEFLEWKEVFSKRTQQVLCTVKASKDEVTFKTVDKHEMASILIDMQYRHIVFVFEKVHVQEEVLADGDDSSRPKKDAFAVLKHGLKKKKKKKKNPTYLPYFFLCYANQTIFFF